MSYVGSYIWSLRQAWGSKPLKVTTVAVFVTNTQGQVLLGKRADTHEWCCLGGSVELLDGVTTTLKREILEETGLEVKDYRFVGIHSTPASAMHTYPGGDQALFIEIMFEVPVGDVQPVLDDEHTEFGWFDLDALPEPFLAVTRGTMHAYTEFRRTGKITIQ